MTVLEQEQSSAQISSLKDMVECDQSKNKTEYNGNSWWSNLATREAPNSNHKYLVILMDRFKSCMYHIYTKDEILIPIQQGTARNDYEYVLEGASVHM